MNTAKKKETDAPTHLDSKKKTSHKKYEVKFEPQLNGTYTINFPKEAENAGFAVLLQGGLFHTFPEGYVISKQHLKLLDEQDIPYQEVVTS